VSDLLSSSSPWIAAGLTLLAAVVVGALVGAGVNMAMRRLLRDPKTGGRVAGAVFWTVVAIGFVVAIGRLAEPTATETGLAAAAERVLTGLPDLLIGLLVLVLGWALAVALRGLLRGVSSRLRLPASDLLPTIAMWVVLVLTILIAAEQVGIQVGLLRQLLLLIVAGIVLAAAVAMGLGTRDLVAAVVAGRHVERIVGLGDEVEVAGLAGRVVELGHASVRLFTADGEVEVPNGVFLSGPVRIVGRRS
jgi:hypothetical protein